jgi:hypothetical protein
MINSTFRRLFYKRKRTQVEFSNTCYVLVQLYLPYSTPVYSRVLLRDINYGVTLLFVRQGTVEPRKAKESHLIHWRFLSVFCDFIYIYIHTRIYTHTHTHTGTNAQDYLFQQETHLVFVKTLLRLSAVEWLACLQLDPSFARSNSAEGDNFKGDKNLS